MQADTKAHNGFDWYCSSNPLFSNYFEGLTALGVDIHAVSDESQFTADYVQLIEYGSSGSIIPHKYLKMLPIPSVLKGQAAWDRVSSFFQEAAELRRGKPVEYFIDALIDADPALTKSEVPSTLL